MTTEELLKPRYKVIADYPDMEDWKVGEILLENWNWHEEGGIKKSVSDYPHLFHKLEWWEERSDEDMPEYVKKVGTGKVYKVADKSQNGRIWHEENEIENRFIRDSRWIPATEQEYLDYQKSLPPSTNS